MSKRFISVLFLLVSLTILLIAISIVLNAGQKEQNVSTQAQSYPPGFQEVQVVSGLTQPTTMEFVPDGRIFVAEKGGSLRIVKNNSLLPQPFLKVSVKSDGERGLLGVTIDPEFNSNRYVYIYYTDDSRSVNRVVRYTADTANPDIAAAGSETVIFDNIPSVAGYHNGGALHFGTDGMLYIAVGESHTSSNSQSMDTIAGKLLRINKDGTIPADNPFYQNAIDNNRAIYALGLRNPFTFAVNPVNGKIFVNDVGSSKFEEINDIQKGGNYGWPTCEGVCDRGFVNPIHAYGRDVGKAITGGVFYTGTNFPSEYQGSYFFADYLGNWIKRLNPATNQVSTFVTNLQSPVDLRTGTDGLLYYLTYNRGAVYRIQYGSGLIPTQSVTSPPANDNIQVSINKPAEGTTYSAGDTIEYTGTATDAQDGVLTAGAFRWKVETVHNDHTHPFADWSAGSMTGSFKTGITGEADPVIRYRIYLSVTNSRNQIKEVTRDILPNNVTMEFTSDPAGMELTIDGQPQKAPFTVTGVAGFEREIGAASSQMVENRNFSFISWSDEGSAVHKILTPKTNTTYKAVYKEGFLIPTTYCLGPCVTSVTPTIAGGATSPIPTGSNPAVTIGGSNVPSQQENKITSPEISDIQQNNGQENIQQGRSEGLIRLLLNLILKILELLMNLLR